MDQDTACTAVGVLAIGAILCHYRERAAHPPSACSSGAVSARAATVGAPLNGAQGDAQGAQGDGEDSMWGFSDSTAAQQFQSAVPNPRQSTANPAVASLQQNLEEQVLSKNLGVVMPRVGCTFDSTQPNADFAKSQMIGAPDCFA